MFSIKKHNLYSSLRFKLTAWSSLIFTVVFFLVFLTLQLYVRNHFMELTDAGLFEKVKRQLYLGYPSKDDMMSIKSISDIFDFISAKEGNSDVFYFYLDSSYKIITCSSLEHWPKLRFDSTNIPYIHDKPGREQIKTFLNLKYSKERKTALLDLNHDFGSHTILQTITVPSRNDKSRVAFQHFNNNTLFITGISLGEKNEFNNILTMVSLLSYVVLLLAVTVLVNFLTKNLLRGVEKVRNTALNIDKNMFDGRVPYQSEPTEIKSLAKAFNEMLDRIENLVKQQKQITHNVAHDLRSPITSIRGIAETTLSSRPTIPEFEKMTGRIISNCDRLVHLINSILDIADIESGNFRTQIQNIALQNIIEECYEVYKPLAEEKKIDLIRKGLENKSQIRGNRQLLQRAFGNVVGNAIKYTQTGGSVLIDVSQKHQKVEVSISDDGIGIEKNEQKLIFERFYRIDKSRSVEGNGLGLSLAKAYIEYQYGRIEVHSEVGRGAVFTITLPTC